MKLCVIPARGGSKRIPGKNLRPFCGKPILLYSVEAAQQSGLFDRIVVSTDSDEIAALAREHGAEVPFVRPPELSDDFTGTNAVVRHAIEWFVEQGAAPDWVCCIYATAPFLSAERIREGFERLEPSGRAFAFSVTSFHDAGQFYWGTAEAFLTDQPLFARHSLAIRLPRHLVQDIDTFEDWARAERMFRAAQGAEPESLDPSGPAVGSD